MIKPTLSFLIIAASEDETLQDCDVLVVTVLTHGDVDGCLLSKTEDYKTSDVWKPFKNNDYLRGKPKIFIFVVCCNI